MKCADDKEAQAAEKRIPDLEKTRDCLMAEQTKLPMQTNAVAGEYVHLENSIPAERWNQVKNHRRFIFLDHWEALLQKLKEIYGAKFNRELYDDAQRYVNDHLPERKRIEKQQSCPEQGISRAPMKEDEPKQRRRNENIL